jgi:integrase
MPGQTFALSEYPFEWIELACEKCERHGKLRKARLIREHGPDMGAARLRGLLIIGSPEVRQVARPVPRVLRRAERVVGDEALRLTEGRARGFGRRDLSQREAQNYTPEWKRACNLKRNASFGRGGTFLNSRANSSSPPQLGHRDATMLLVAYRHGLRASELVDLRWEQVDFRAATCASAGSNRAPSASTRLCASYAATADEVGRSSSNSPALTVGQPTKVA